MGNFEALTPKEREWAFDLEEAIFDNCDVRSGQSTAGGTTRAGRLRSRLRGRNNSNEGSTPTNQRAMTALYGRPSDFEIVAHALRAKGDTSRALKRLHRIKMFKDSYNVPLFDIDNREGDSDPLEPIVNLMRKFLTAYPHFIQKIGLDNHGRVAVQFRLEELRWSQPPPFNHTDIERFQALYYLLQATQPTLESIRRGTVWIGDLEKVTERPSPALFRGGRMLLRDSYPIKVEDIPVVDCPPRFSKVYATTYPFFSSHFVSKLVRVTPGILRTHFPPELLSERLRGVDSSKKRSTNSRRYRKTTVDDNNGRKENVDIVVLNSSNGDEYENAWETLDDDDDDNEDFTEFGQQRGVGNSSNHKQANEHVEEIWTRIERLLRMRLETERNFRIV